MTTVIDFSAAFPSAAAIKAAGHDGVVAYISPARASWMKAKPLTKTKVAEYKAAGLKIAVVWQYGGADAPDAMRGAAGGKADAEAAQKQLTAIGLSGHPVYFAVDFDISLAQWNATAVAYFRAAVGVLGKQRVGIYGHSKVAHWAMEDDVVATVAPGRVLGWVTNSWSNGATGAAYSTLYQGTHNVPGPDSVQIDINTVRHPEWGHRAIPTPKEPAVDLTSLPQVAETIWMNKNFTRGRHINGQSVKVEKITRHHMGGIGDTQQCWNWWQTRAASAHFAVDRNGKVGQLVRESDTAHANADPASNAVSIAIEHSNSAGPDQDWPISNATIDSGARLAAELCIKHGLGRPLFGKNIDDHCDHSATACPYHLATGGKYHARWMRVAQEHYDKLTTQSKEDAMTPAQEKMLREVHHQLLTRWDQLGKKTLVDAVAEIRTEMRLAGDQLSGPGRTDKGGRSFGGWDLTSALDAARKKNFAGVTLVEGVAVLLVGTDDDIAAVRRANKEEK